MDQFPPIFKSQKCSTNLSQGPVTSDSPETALQNVEVFTIKVHSPVFNIFVSSILESIESVFVESTIPKQNKYAAKDFIKYIMSLCFYSYQI